MPVQIYISEQIVTACLSGEIDHHCAKALREEIDTTAQRVHPEELVLDFRDITFMDSSGIGLVMGRYQLMQELGGKVHIANLSSQMARVMRLAGLDRLVAIEKEVKKA